MLLKILRSFYWVPVLGMLLREALDGPDEARYLFAGNLVMFFLLAVIVFGFQAFVTIMLTAVALMFIVIFDITRGERPLSVAPDQHHAD
jgi:hypothetical protein